jgi:non-specific serine/threonine protein kinase
VGDAARLAFGLNVASAMAAGCCDFRRARALAEEYLTLAEALEDRSSRANCLFRLGEAAGWEGKLAAAQALLAEALAIYREADDRYGVAMAAAELSRVQLRRGEVERARALGEECLALARQSVGEGNLLIRALRAAGEVALARGEVPAAASYYHEGLAGLESCFHEEFGLTIIEGLARVAAARGRAGPALRLAGAAAAERTRFGAEAAAIDRWWTDAAVARSRGLLSGTEADAAWAEGQAMTLEDAIKLAESDYPSSQPSPATPIAAASAPECSPQSSDAVCIASRVPASTQPREVPRSTNDAWHICSTHQAANRCVSSREPRVPPGTSAGEASTREKPASTRMGRSRRPKKGLPR